MKTERKNNNNNYNNISMSQIYLKILHNFHNQQKNKESLKSKKLQNSSSTFHNDIKEIPYSIKPLLCSIPKDINLQEIFINMMNSSFKINGNKSIYLKMSQKELSLRKFILNCIKMYINKYKFPKKLLCSIIFLYDILTIRNIEKRLISSPEEIAIGATVLTLKFINGKKKSAYSIKNFSTIFFDDKINESNINEIEISCLKLMDYYLSYASPITFMEILFINGIIFSTDNIKREEGGKIYELVIEIIEKVMIISNEYIKYNPLCLCSCIVSFAREINNLEKWPQILMQAFGVNFNSFENIYNEYYDLIMQNKKIKNQEEEDENNHKKDNKNNNKEIIEIKDDKTKMKLHITSPVFKNKPSIIYRYKKPIKAENEKQPKNLRNEYSNPNFLFNSQVNSLAKTGKYNIDNSLNKNIFNKIKTNNYLNIDDKDKDISEESLPIKSKKIKEVEISNFSGNRNSSLFLYEKKLNWNYNNDQLDKKINTQKKEEDYSNVATSDNSGNYKNKFKKSYKYKNLTINNNHNDQCIKIKDNKESNYLYQSTIISPSQKSYKKNGEIWSSIKRFNRIRNDNSNKKGSFYPLSGTKSIYVKKIYI